MVVAARSARRRAVHDGGAARTHSNSRLHRIDFTQRSSVGQRRALAPQIAHGLTLSRTTAAPNRSAPKSASAHPIADAEYNRCASISRGPTVQSALHFVQR